MKESPAEDAKTYMSTRQVPQLFESLMTGLMFHRPDDHLEFLIDCLHKVKESGSNVVNWNSFVEPRRGSALPPISTTSKHESSSSDEAEPARSTSVSKESSKEITKTSPLPPIGKSRETTLSATSPVNIETTVPIVLVIGPPGCGKLTQSQRVIEHYKKYNWVHLSMGDLIRQELFKRGDAEAKWKIVADLVRKGEMAPEDITQSLVRDVLKAHPDAGGFLIEGYPRTMEQVDEFNRIIGRVELVLLLDSSEQMCHQRLLQRRQKSQRIDDNETAVNRRVEFFKQNTLTVVQYFENQGKLVPLQADRDADEIFSDITSVMDVAFYGRKPATVDIQPPRSLQTPKTPPSYQASKPLSPLPDSSVLMNGDEGRKAGFPDAPIIFIMGGPGCGKGAQCERLVGRFPGLIHLSMGDILRTEISTHGSANEKIRMLCELIYNGGMIPNEIAAELLISNIMKHKSASAFVVEGFPRDKNQLEDFNKQIGGLARAILLECEEATLIRNVESRQETSGRQDDRPAPLSRRIEHYKTNTLPVIKYLHEQNKLTMLSAEGRSVDDIHADLSSEINFILHNGSPKVNGETEQNEVEEAAIVADVAHTTGGDSDIGQPTNLSKHSTDSKESSGSSESNTDGEKQHTDISKESTDAEKQPTDNSKESTKTSQEGMAELKGKKVVFVVGGPGCGKGTQCAKIVEKYGFCHLSSGDLLRDEVQSGSERGKELNSIMESGALVSLDVVLTLLKEAMVKNSSAKGFLIDGYPRELEQGTRFEAELVAPACVLYFEVPDDVMVERLLGRAKTSGRVDDNEETIKKRLKTFHNHCDKVLEHYEGKNLLCKIDARGQVDDIFGEVVKRIDSTN